jgi:asparagine synthase (glutamine-hydrolysing)
VNRFVVAFDEKLASFRASGPADAYDGCRAVSSGFIANAAELRAEAVRRGYETPRANDALFALAYRWWGDALQRRVLGEYAVAAFDERLRTLLFTHDALGIVPGFFAQLGDRIVMASHLDDVVRRVADRALDDDYVADVLALGWPAGGRTPYRAVRRLRPGVSLTWSDGRARERTTWSLADVAPVRLANDAEYEERARALIAEGVRTALDADGPVWSELSGGLDSSTVICTAAAACGRALPAFSFVYSRSADADERFWMNAVLRHYDLTAHRIDVDRFPPFAELPAHAFAEPNAVAPVWPLWRAYTELLERNGVAVMLTGVGGDNLFATAGSQPKHLADALVRLDPSGFARELTAWQRRGPVQRSLLHWLAGSVARPLLLHARGRNVLDDGSAAFEPPPWIAPRFAHDKHVRERMRRAQAPRCAAPGDQYFAESLHAIGMMSGTNRDVLARSFAFRHPLLYRPLVEFAFAIPWEQRTRPDESRSVQRRAMAGILPEAVRLREGKRGAQHAYFEGLRTASAWLGMLRERPQLVERGYAGVKTWNEAVERARFGRTHSMRHLLAAAALESWLRQPALPHETTDITATITPATERAHR